MNILGKSLYQQFDISSQLSSNIMNYNIQSYQDEINELDNNNNVNENSVALSPKSVDSSSGRISNTEASLPSGR